MAKVRARAPHVLLRAVLLVVGLGLIGGVTVLLMAHRFAASVPSGAVVAPPPGVEETAEGEVLRGKRFTFTATVENRKLFTISAESIRQDRNDQAYLQGVRVDLYRENGDVVRVTSDEADYDPKSLDAELRGHVELRGETLELDTRALQLSQKGQVLTTPGDVELRYPPDLEGRANGLRVDLEEDRYLLSDGVHLRSVPGAAVPFRLDCDRLHHDQAEGLVRAVGEVRLTRGGDVIQAENLTALFENRMSDLRTVRARIDVRGDFFLDRDGPNPRRVTAKGKVLVAQLDPVTGAAERVELDGDVGSVSDLAIIDATGLGYAFTGQRLVAYLAKGIPQLVEGFGSALRMTEMIDAPEPVILRQACAAQVAARFSPLGELAQVRFEGAVELIDKDVYLAGGDIADVDWIGGRVEVRGPAVQLFSRRGDVIAPHFVYRRDRGLIQADGNVRARLPEGSAQMLGDTPLGAGEGPVMVEARRADWTLEPTSFTFLGDVRAWRGTNIVLADQLRGDHEGRRLTASGDPSAASPVKTTWVPKPRPGTPEASAGPIEITGDQLSYDSDAGTLVYTGDVDARQGSSRLRCRELTVELTDGGGQAERMLCRGNVELVDAARGRTVVGELARYALDVAEVEVFGEPVEVTETAGNAFTCRYLLYDVTTGAVSVRSRPPGGDQNPDTAGGPRTGGAG